MTRKGPAPNEAREAASRLSPGAESSGPAVEMERDRLLREREEMRASEMALRETTQRMDDFLAVASHELRTPLTSVLANIQLAQRQARALYVSTEDESTLTIMRLLDRSERQAHLLNRLVGDLLDATRAQSGQLQLHTTRFDLRATVEEIVSELRQLYPRRVIELTQLGAPVLVAADAERVSQVMTNLLSNALRYAPAAEPVDVHVEAREGQARVLVRDRGLGIPEEQQQRIWERFYRVPGVGHESGSGVGLGLGLFISKAIIQQLGGEMGVRSARGEGATFWFSLPLAVSAASDL